MQNNKTNKAYKDFCSGGDYAPEVLVLALSNLNYKM